MTDPSDPGDLASGWRANVPLQAPRPEPRARALAVHRRALLEQLAVVVVPLGGLAVIAMALAHAANGRERFMGAFAACGTVAAWGVYCALRIGERRVLGASVPEYVGGVVRRRRGEQRLAQFVLFTVGLELAFLVPWWIGGIGKHGHEMLSSVVILTLWLPVVAIVAACVWAIRLWTRARHDLTALRGLADDFKHLD